MKAKTRKVGNYEDLLKAVLCGTVRLVNVSPRLRIKDRTLYIYSLRFCRGMQNKKWYDKTIAIMEENLLLIKDDRHRQYTKDLIERYREMIIYD